jgi:galactonate dehydratase
MKIVDIKVFPTWVGTRNQLIIKVETDEGIHGWGESGVSGRELAVAGAIKHYREFLLGKDPLRRGALWQEMYRSQYFEGGRVLTGAISAIDIALYDIAGKALGVPVYQLLGGKQRDFVPCFATTAAPMGPRLIEDAQLLIEKGWNVIRTVPGHPDTGGDPNLFEPRESLALTAEWLSKLREAVGPAPVLGIDYHHRLSVAEAASFCQRMPRGTLDFLEEPIRAESPEAYVALRSMVDVPLAIGEEFASKWAFLPFVERGLTNFIRVDVCNVGGLTEAAKVAGWAEAHYIDLMPHNPLGPICTAATVHLAAAVPNFAWLEVRTSPTEQLGFDNSDLFPMQSRLEGDRFAVPEAPGLGVEFNEKLASEREFQFWEAPHLHRRDNSYTNW